jgi:hypothetical protein
MASYSSYQDINTILSTFRGKKVEKIEMDSKHLEIEIDRKKLVFFNLATIEGLEAFVEIKECAGDLDAIRGELLTQAEIVAGDSHQRDDNYTVKWSFLKLSTIKGYVTVAWHGWVSEYYTADIEMALEPTYSQQPIK